MINLKLSWKRLFPETRIKMKVSHRRYPFQSWIRTNKYISIALFQIETNPWTAKWTALLFGQKREKASEMWYLNCDRSIDTECWGSWAYVSYLIWFCAAFKVQHSVLVFVVKYQSFRFIERISQIQKYFEWLSVDVNIYKRNPKIIPKNPD